MLAKAIRWPVWRIRHSKVTTRTLVAGPYIGEFGWELMEWQGYVRRLGSLYERTIAISYETSRYLYGECEFYSHHLSLAQSCFGYGVKPANFGEGLVEAAISMKLPKQYDLLTPWDMTRPIKLLIGGQQFVRFREPVFHDLKVDILFHLRRLIREDGDEKNYSREEASRIVEDCRSHGLTMGFIGLPEYSDWISPARDLRSNDLGKTISAICSARLIVGGSSGPMHLAALCAKPIVVWTGHTGGAERYRSYWNPFSSDVFIVTEETFRPPAESVVRTLLQALEEIE